jgi:hypothetical protein
MQQAAEAAASSADAMPEVTTLATTAAAADLTTSGAQAKSASVVLQPKAKHVSRRPLTRGRVVPPPKRPLPVGLLPVGLLVGTDNTWTPSEKARPKQPNFAPPNHLVSG